MRNIRNSNEAYSFDTYGEAMEHLYYLQSVEHIKCKVIKDAYNYTVITINPKAQKIINSHLGQKIK